MKVTALSLGLGLCLFFTGLEKLRATDYPNNTCGGYSAVCSAFTCYDATDGTCEGNNFTRISQTQLMLGGCQPSQGSTCTYSTYTCSTMKYNAADSDGCTEANRVCTVTADRNGCAL